MELQQIKCSSARQQIPIYVLDASNFDSILPKLPLSSDSREDIANGIAAGKVAIVPGAQPRDMMGYVLQDPSTGAGAYIIEHGGRGGDQSDCGESPKPIPKNVTVTVLAAFAIAIIAAVLIAVSGPAVLAYIGSVLFGLGRVLAPLLSYLTVPFLLAAGNAYATPREPCCAPIPVAHSGGDTLHDYCADNFTLPNGNEFYGFDALVDIRKFDAITSGRNWLWEVKTNNVDNISDPDFYDRMITAKEAKQINEHITIAEKCGFRYAVLVGDSRYPALLIPRLTQAVDFVVNASCKRPGP